MGCARIITHLYTKFLLHRHYNPTTLGDLMRISQSMSPKIPIPRRSHSRGITDVTYSNPESLADATIDIQSNALSTRMSFPKRIFESSPKPQLDALLWILPPEIRCHIWKQILGGRTIHLDFELGAPRAVECVSSDPSKCYKAPSAGGCHMRNLNNQMAGRLNLLPLLLTCKSMSVYSSSHVPPLKFRADSA